MKRVLLTVAGTIVAASTTLTLAAGPAGASTPPGTARTVTATASSTSSRATPDGSAATAAVTLNGGKFNANYVNIRSKPSTSGGTIYGQGQKGQYFCFDNFIYNSSWYLGTRGQTHEGYVLNRYITYLPNNPCYVT